MGKGKLPKVNETLGFQTQGHENWTIWSLLNWFCSKNNLSYWELQFLIIPERGRKEGAGAENGRREASKSEWDSGAILLTSNEKVAWISSGTDSSCGSVNAECRAVAATTSRRFRYVTSLNVSCVLSTCSLSQTGWNENKMHFLRNTVHTDAQTFRKEPGNLMAISEWWLWMVMVNLFAGFRINCVHHKMS